MSNRDEMYEQEMDTREDEDYMSFFEKLSLAMYLAGALFLTLIMNAIVYPFIELIFKWKKRADHP
jgi:hypothetical protein